MERYEAYKNSGVEWLGEIPVGWEVKRFRYVFNLITDKVGDNLLKIGLENIESGSGKFVATDNEFEGDGIHFLSGDILFGKLRPYLAKVYLADFRGKAVGDFFVFRSKGEIKEQFGAKLISSKRFIDITNSSTYGSKMPRVSWDFISELLIAYPNLEEQTAIANFLDRKTAEIDALIAQKERLLELYEEEKTAIINHAVTKGIDPNAELKNSRVDRLGKIPVGWEVKKLKYLLNFHDNQRIPLSAGQRAHMKNKKYDYYGASGVIDQVEGYIFDGDFILLGEDGANLLTRSTALAFKASGKFWVNNHAHILSPKNGELDFFVHFLESTDYAIFVSGSAQPKLTAEALGTVDLLEPPKDQQTAIVQHIEAETARINTKIAKTQRIIELQKEYRTALISEAVTGKVKVPELPTQEASA